MTTETKTAEKTETKTDDYVGRYFDALLNTYDILVKAADKANERGFKASKELGKELASGQREALELSRQVAGEPNPAKFYSTLLEATMKAQSRALAFSQIAYQESLGAGTDARETIEEIVEANRSVTEAAVEAARGWATSNPVADMFRQQMERIGKTSK